MMEFLLGLVIGLTLGAYFAWDRFLRHEKPRINIDAKLVDRMEERMVLEWLDRRGLMWQPKGIDFKVKGAANGRH